MACYNGCSKARWSPLLWLQGCSVCSSSNATHETRYHMHQMDTSSTIEKVITPRNCDSWCICNGRSEAWRPPRGRFQGYPACKEYLQRMVLCSIGIGQLRELACLLSVQQGLGAPLWWFQGYPACKKCVQQVVLCSIDMRQLRELAQLTWGSEAWWPPSGRL